jgi:hypothetical protein
LYVRDAEACGGLKLLDVLAQLLDLLEHALPSAVGSIIGSSTGVFIGFWLNRRNLTRANQERAEGYLKGLTNEISEAIGLLGNKKLQLLSDDLWQSAVNSGDLALFPYEPREDLRKAYFAMRKCNYEAIRARDLGEKFRAEADTPEKEQRIGMAWRATTIEAMAMAENTLSYLQSLSKKQWFIKASEYKAT